MITYSNSHVDLMSNITFTVAQLNKRWERELQRNFSPSTQHNLRDLNQIKNDLPDNHPRKSAKNTQLVSSFIADRLSLMDSLDADLAKNELLIGAIAYEMAGRDKESLLLRINGRPAVEAQVEVVDPNTLEVLQEAIQPVSEIEAIVDTKDSFDIDGNPITIQNPAKYDPVSGVLARIDGAQVVLDGATQDTLDLVALRV